MFSIWKFPSSFEILASILSGIAHFQQHLLKSKVRHRKFMLNLQVSLNFTSGANDCLP